MISRTLTLLLLLLVFSWFIMSFPHVANDLQFISIPELKNQFSWPYLWLSSGTFGLGQYSPLFLSSWMTNVVYGFFGVMGFPFNQILIFLWLLPFLFLGMWGLERIFNQNKISAPGKIIGTLFYFLNSYIILLIDGGQLGIAFSYILIPLSFSFFVDLIEKKEISNYFKFLLTIFGISIFDARVLYLLGICIALLLTLRIILEKEHRLNYLKKGFLTFFLSSIFLALIHLYWILPAFVSKTGLLPTTYERSQQVDFLNFSTISDSLFLHQPHWYKNIFGQISNTSLDFLIIPILAFMAPILIKKNKNVLFWTTIALIGIFLSKGNNEPFPQVYSWLFLNIPGFSFFRDSSKFYILIAISYSVLIAMVVNWLDKRIINNNFKIKFIKVDSKSLLIGILIAYLLLIIRPVFLGKMTGILSKPIYTSEFNSLAEYLKNDPSNSKVLWIPSRAPLGYSDLNHPAIEGIRLIDKRPFASGIKGTYETLNYLREEPFVGQFLSMAGVGYIAFPYLNPKRDNLHPDNINYYYLFLNQIKQLPYVKEVIGESQIPLLKLEEKQETFFVAPKLFGVVGSDDLYYESTKSGSFKIKNNAFVFLDERPELSKIILNDPDAKYLLNKKTELDLAASFIDQKNFILPAKNLDFSPDKTGWWKKETSDLIYWREFLQTKYNIDNQDFDLLGGWAISEGAKTLNLDIPSSKGTQTILVRAMESPKGGSLSFSNRSRKIGTLETIASAGNVKWFEVGDLNENENQITIDTQGDINVVNVVAVINKAEWTTLKEKVTQLKKEDKIVTLNYLRDQDFSVNIKSKMINPTKYLVTVTNLKSPSYLIFAQSFDNGWEIQGQKSTPVYSLFNSFKITADGEYIVELTLQKYVFIGLFFSVLTLLATIILTIKFKKK